MAIVSGRYQESSSTISVRSAGDLLGGLLGQRSVRLHLVHVDPEQQLEIVGERLEERPLVALEVHPHGAAHRRQRLVSAGVEQLDQDVRVAVGFPVRAPRLVQARASDSSPGRGPAGSRGRCGAGCVTPIAARPPRLGHARTSNPCAWNSAIVIRSRPKPRHAVWAALPSSSSMSYAEAKWSWW